MARGRPRGTEGDRGGLRDSERVAGAPPPGVVGAYVERGEGGPRWWVPPWAMTAGLRAHAPGHAGPPAGLQWAPAFCREAERQTFVLTPELGGV